MSYVNRNSIEISDGVRPLIWRVQIDLSSSKSYITILDRRKQDEAFLLTHDIKRQGRP